MIRAVVVALLWLLMPSPAAAWGELGHRVIGELAERRLSPEVRAQVRDLLASEAEPTLAAVSTWPDALRERPEFRWTAPLHYINIRDASCRYDAVRDCEDGLCVVGAIQRYARELGDSQLDRQQRAEALKFLVHFVGDVHQPLHTGHRPDKGGNDFQISVPRPGNRPIATTLHGIWDHFLPTRSRESLDEYVTRLQSVMPPMATAAIDLDADPAGWAQSSCLLTESEGFYPRRPGKLPPDYFERMQPLVDARLQLAAARLALLLETTLHPSN